MVNLLQSQSYFRFRELEEFLQFLWFIEDNSICLEKGYGYLPEIDKVMFLETHISNSTSTGEFVETSFSIEQIKRAYEIMQQYSTISSFVITEQHTPFNNHSIVDDNVKRMTAHPEVEHYNEYSRIGRAMLFLASARNELTIAHKISMYVPVFECLFSLDNDEIKHKVAERVAFYIVDTKEDRVNIYSIVSEAYNIRSRYLHGDELKSNKKNISNDTLKNISKQIDSLLRKILTKIIMKDSKIFLLPKDDEKKDGKTVTKGLRSYLNSLIFQ